MTSSAKACYVHAHRFNRCFEIHSLLNTDLPPSSPAPIFLLRLLHRRAWTRSETSLSTALTLNKSLLCHDLHPLSINCYINYPWIARSRSESSSFTVLALNKLPLLLLLLLLLLLHTSFKMKLGIGPCETSCPRAPHTLSHTCTQDFSPCSLSLAYTQPHTHTPTHQHTHVHAVSHTHAHTHTHNWKGLLLAEGRSARVSNLKSRSFEHTILVVLAHGLRGLALFFFSHSLLVVFWLMDSAHLDT